MKTQTNFTQKSLINALTLFIAALLMLTSCSDDKPEPINNPPEAFELHEFGWSVSSNPTISWDEASDPDSDPVTYDLYIVIKKSGFEDAAPLATDIKATSYSIPEGQTLIGDTVYECKILAKDGKGGETWSNTIVIITLAIGDIS